MPQITQTLTYKKDDSTGEIGWNLDSIPGFFSIPLGSKNMGDTLTHDLIEHRSNVATGTLANEIHALGATWGNRYYYEGIVEKKNLAGDIENILEHLGSEMGDLSSLPNDGEGLTLAEIQRSIYDNQIEILDTEIPLIDRCGDLEEIEEVEEFIRECVNSHSAEWFDASFPIAEDLILRITNWMMQGWADFTETWGGNLSRGIFSTISHNLGYMLHDMDSVLDACGEVDLISGVEIWEGMQINVTIDTDAVDVEISFYGESKYAIEEIKAEYAAMGEEEEEEEEE